MNLALFGAYHLIHPLHHVVRNFMPTQALQNTHRPMPLRVARVIEEAPHNRNAAGRMIISGRMADVCAELERLAKFENQH